MSDLTELDRLIEEGLTLYGQGDIDGALVIWERVLVADPDNAQANSYVDYVRMNYELLTSDLDGETTTSSGPFGIGADEPEYQIEISPGAEPAPVPGAPMFMDPADEGWAIDSDRVARPLPLGAPPEDDDPPSVTLELEADEPDDYRPSTASDDSFEAATREYDAATHARAPSNPPESEFGPEGTPPFGDARDVSSFGPEIETKLRERDTGFVRVTKEQVSPPRDLEISLRTPQHTDDIATAELHPASPSTDSEVPTDRRTALDRESSDDLISTLPSPRKRTQSLTPTPAPLPPRAQAVLETLEPSLEPQVPISSAPTRELTGAQVSLSATQTSDFGERPTQQRTNLEALIAAPTRELGLRPAPSPTAKLPTSSVAARTPTEDQPTLTGVKPLDPTRDPQGTRMDIVLPFDPIDARTQQILEDIDETAPAQEAKEDKTRRRITGLLAYAQEASERSELDKAVAAVDLALSEDPNSALAQKLIHRHRDAIMTVFQGFLGDLERQPVLARPLHELGTAPISPRAAFLLSRIDGNVTLDEILDISGMPRLEAYRLLCQLFLRGILR